MQRIRFQKLPLVLAISLISSPMLTAAEDSQNSIEIWSTAINSSSVSLDEGDIESKQADHLSDLLRDIPGVDVGGTNSITQEINIHGFRDTDIEITVDGAPQNAAHVPSYQQYFDQH